VKIELFQQKKSLFKIKFPFEYVERKNFNQTFSSNEVIANLCPYFMGVPLALPSTLFIYKNIFFKPHSLLTTFL
jgi:hypothetical protein